MSVLQVELGRKLGEGAFAEVYRAKVHGLDVALKMYKVGDEETLTDEVKIFSLLGNHPNILEHGPRIDPTVPAIVKVAIGSATPKYPALTLKYYDMTLSDYIRQQREPIAPDLIYSYTAQLLKAVAHCHSLNIAHNDIRPQNILLNTKGKLVLADFNIALVNAVTSGALWYRAPEVLLFNTQHRQRLFEQQPFGLSDLWSVGTVVAEMATCRAIFSGDSEQDMVARICRQIGPPTDNNCPKYFESKVWNQELSTALGRKIEDIIDHDGLEPWFYDLCGGMLAYPLERISAPDALVLIPKSVIVQF